MGNEITSFTIPLEPRTKKNSQMIFYNHKRGRSFISQSPQYRGYEEKAMWYVPRGMTIYEPVNVKCLFYMSTKKRVDVTNLEAAIHDIMVKAGLLADDNRDIVASTDGTRCYYDKDHPRTEVYITAEENYEQWKKGE